MLHSTIGQILCSVFPKNVLIVKILLSQMLKWCGLSLVASKFWANCSLKMCALTGGIEQGNIAGPGGPAGALWTEWRKKIFLTPTQNILNYVVMAKLLLSEARNAHFQPKNRFNFTKTGPFFDKKRKNWKIYEVKFFSGKFRAFSDIRSINCMPNVDFSIQQTIMTNAYESAKLAVYK